MNNMPQTTHILVGEGVRSLTDVESITSLILLHKADIFSHTEGDDLSELIENINGWSEMVVVSDELLSDVNLLLGKKAIVEALRSWALTFDWDEEDENEDDSFDIINGLADRVEAGTHTEDDIKEIEFHIWQINQGE